MNIESGSTKIKSKSPYYFSPQDNKEAISKTALSSSSPHSFNESGNLNKSTTPHIASQEFILKIVLIGDSAVGKSNLVMRFTKNDFKKDTTQTIGFEFATKNIRVGSRQVKAQIWDTAGQERFQSLTAAYYRNAVGALVVYDITNRASFEHVPIWLKQIRLNAHENLVLILVGNKSDLAHQPHTRKVSTLEAARFAEKNNMEFVETSALDATNVVDAFKRIIVPIGRLLSPQTPQEIVKLPSGWRRVASRTRPGEYSYENQYTKERIAFFPTEPAIPSQYNFQVGHQGIKAVGITVTRETLQQQNEQFSYAGINRVQSSYYRKPFESSSTTLKEHDCICNPCTIL